MIVSWGSRGSTQRYFMIKDAYAFLNFVILTILLVLIHVQVVPSFGGKSITDCLDIDDFFQIAISLL